MITDFSVIVDLASDATKEWIKEIIGKKNKKELRDLALQLDENVVKQEKEIMREEDTLYILQEVTVTQDEKLSELTLAIETEEKEKYMKIIAELKEQKRELEKIIKQQEERLQKYRVDPRIVHQKQLANALRELANADTKEKREKVEETIDILYKAKIILPTLKSKEKIKSKFWEKYGGVIIVAIIGLLSAIATGIITYFTTINAPT